MSRSQIACAIGNTSSAFVRIKSSGSGSYVVTACKVLPLGREAFEGKKQARSMKKLLALADEWRGEALALCFCPGAYFPLHAYFPCNAPKEACADYCRIEAAHFLHQPEEFLHDNTAYADSAAANNLEKHLVLFYRAEPFKTLSIGFAERHPLLFCGSPLIPALHHSLAIKEKTAFLDLENTHVVLTVANKGKLEYFNCHPVKERKEAEYFAIHELQSNPLIHDCAIQAGGSLFDKTMTTLLEKETSCHVVPPGLPDGVHFSGRDSSVCRSSAAVKAICTAVMAIEN
ncbi:conserved hypothetical protein [Chlorobium limicola DSM 245]|uniref:Uncharacterized protein n=2 Tax=Chlorobium limicola TaxID=1092 RepID=B3EGP1_CHLL2|nr:conserved hypothetical protein [Chlorobium limicola DSM 245]